MARHADKLGLNMPEEHFLSNVRTNIRRPLPQAQPYDDQEIDIILAAGGPSLEENFDTLKEMHEAGMPVVAVNGSFAYLLDRGIQPAMCMMVDSRDFNVRFVERAKEAPKCKFFIAAQAHPDVFDFLEEQGSDVTIWHSDYEGKRQRAVFDWYVCERPNTNYFEVLGGCTIVLRTIWLLSMLGFPNQHIFGLDSCMSDDGTHHAYPQKENDNDVNTVESFGVTVAGRSFRVAPWMVSQAENFMDLVKHGGDHFNLEVYGDGLISWIMRHGADTTELTKKENNNGGSTLESL
jgi:hypothetical protein